MTLLQPVLLILAVVYLICLSGCNPEIDRPALQSNIVNDRLPVSHSGDDAYENPGEPLRVSELPQREVVVSSITPPNEPEFAIEQPTFFQPVTAAIALSPNPTEDSKKVHVSIKILIAGGHYVYAPTETKTPFHPLSVELNLPSGVEIEEDWSYPPASLQKEMPVYHNAFILRCSLRYSIAPSAPIEATVRYQVCNDEICFPPATIHLATQAVSTKTANPSVLVSKKDLRVLYVGSERTEEYVGFLKEHFNQFEVVERTTFRPEQAEGFDVVLLDWPQSIDLINMKAGESPLGQRDDWGYPTVLLGSAGLNLAFSWKIRGGAGCTCMDPLAYELRDHEIFHHPKEIPLEARIRIPTPYAFIDSLDQNDVEVLPLVDQYKKRWASGWCTYPTDFDKNPDVEIFCGGVNRKSPTAVGLWRQGNLLHFGFEQSPREMNEHGQQLLLNSIAYISKFSDDRPIATTPSVFGGPVACSRQWPADQFEKEGFQTDWILERFEPETRKILEGLGSSKQQIDWCRQHAAYFCPAESQLLKIDEDLLHLKVAFDAPEFFDRVLSGLESSNASDKERSLRLLTRYVPCGLGREASAVQWRAWLEENSPYIFALDTGDYRWYIDQLAKNRQIPSSDLRGPLRADR